MLERDAIVEEFDRNVMLTIQGGGIYGFSLIGQLKALLGAGYKPVAIAGISAGALIATLYWAGYSPEAILQLF